MNDTSDLSIVANLHHEALPRRIRAYLNGRGISDAIIDLHRLGWNGRRIMIPIANQEGVVSFFKLARDPEDDFDSPKMLSTRGSSVELYGWERVRVKPDRIVICEGEFDRLVLESCGVAAVTSTGGAGTFKPEWAEYFTPIPEVFVCFDRDEAGKSGALRIGQMISHAKIVELPPEVGPGGDVTDFFIKLKGTPAGFFDLLKKARTAPPNGQPAPRVVEKRAPDSIFSERVSRLKKGVPIASVVGQYVELRPSGMNFRGLCPFHADENPSMSVYPSTGTFHCFGCGMHGDIITFLMQHRQLSFGQALDALEELANDDGEER